MDPRTRGFKIDGVHSWYDQGIVIHDNPQISYPEKIKEEEVIPGTNIAYDVSSLVSGIQPYRKRQIKLGINILYQPDINITTTQMFAEHVFNWVYSGSGQKRLELDIIPYHYFLGEVVNSHEFTTNLLEIGYADIIFECYPFRISNNPVGEKTFGEINIMNDWIQDSVIELPNISQVTTNQLSIGDTVAIGGWAKKSKNGVDITRFHLSQMYTLKTITSTDVTFNENSLTMAISDIVQRYTPVKFSLMNNGPANIVPQMLISKNEGNSMNAGITIEKDGVFHPIVISDQTQSSTLETSETFVLTPGTNDMMIYGSGFSIDFIFREERL